MHGLATFDPFAEFRALQRQLFGDDMSSWFTTTKGMQMAPTDVYTMNDKELVIEAHLPNFEMKDVDVSIDEGMLMIRADKHEKMEDKDKHYVMRESSTSFYRQLRLPDNANPQRVQATMENGLLMIKMPLKKLNEPKHIAITGAKTDK